MKRVDLSQLKNTAAVQDVAPVSFAIPTHGIVSESRVDVLYMLPPAIDDDGVMHSMEDRLSNRCIRVKVWSGVRPMLFSFTDIKCAGKSQSEMRRTVERAAPALGERQEILYGDCHELSVLSKKAGEHFVALCAYIEKQQA